MGTTSNPIKQKWNHENYTQIKVSVKPEIAKVFKERCKNLGVSMASELSQFMEGPKPCTRKDIAVCSDVTTRPLRRKEISFLLRRLQTILDAEERYKDAIPENLQNSRAYDVAEQCVCTLQEAIELLQEAY